MENTIDLKMADRLQELRDEKEQLELALKETNGMIEAIKRRFSIKNIFVCWF